MTQDLLSKATKALSESGHEQQGGRFTRERLMGSLHERKRRSNTRFAVFLPLAAIFVGSTAFAAATGSLQVFVISALNVVGMAPAESSDAVTPSDVKLPAEHRPHTRPAAAPSEASAIELEPVPSVEPTPSLVEVESSTKRPHTAPGVAPAAGSATSRAGESAAKGVDEVVRADDAHATYRAAHMAQFKQNDCAKALAGYAEYLAHQPAGRFAVDARYNRILCLVRLGRSADARADLRRFADGAYGGYRQSDAERLLAALDEAK